MFCGRWLQKKKIPGGPRGCPGCVRDITNASFATEGCEEAGKLRAAKKHLTCWMTISGSASSTCANTTSSGTSLTATTEANERPAIQGQSVGETPPPAACDPEARAWARFWASKTRISGFLRQNATPEPRQGASRGRRLPPTETVARLESSRPRTPGASQKCARRIKALIQVLNPDIDAVIAVRRAVAAGRLGLASSRAAAYFRD